MRRAHPETNVFFRKLTAEYPIAVRGSGCWIEDAAGRRYLDACGGAFVVNVGHGVAAIGEAMAVQARQLAYVNGMSMTTDVVEQLATELVSLSPAGLSRVYPLSSGSDAVEAALKLARQHWVERGEPDKHRVIALSPAYHGNTLLALSASAREHYRQLYRDWLVEVDRIPAPYAYRCECGGRPPYCPACSGEALERGIESAGPKSVAAFIAEPVGGSSTGASTPPPDYFRRVREICDRHHVLFIADEILVGAGRTGTWSALEPYGVVPDIQILGKGIAGGYAPLSVVIASENVVAPIAAGTGAFVHAQTFSHHPVLCAAGVATIRYLREHRLVERAAATGRRLQEALGALRAAPYVGDVRGRGMLAAIELVRDPATRAPFPRSSKLAERLTRAALDAGLIVWPNVGHAGNGEGDLVMVAPPFIITEEEIAEIVTRLRVALDAVQGEDQPRTRAAVTGQPARTT